MRIAFEGRWFRFELELGAPTLRLKKYQILPRRTCFQVQESLWRGIATRLQERALSQQ